MIKCRLVNEDSKYPFSCQMSDYLREPPQACWGNLSRCGYASEYPGLKRFVAEEFAKGMDKIFAQQKITRENKTQILGEFRSFFGNEQAFRKYVEERDSIGILAPLDEMLHDLVKEQRMGYSSYAQTLMSLDNLMNEWAPVFARFEPSATKP